MSEGRTILFSDESGFYLLPHVVRSYAPVGETPVLKHRLGREHLSAICAISAEGQLLISVQREPYKSKSIIKFLRYLLCKIEGKILLVWDGASIHRSREVKAFLSDVNGLANGSATMAAEVRLQVERLPPYAPELNPSEGIWQRLKCVALKNVASPTLDLLHSHLRRAIYHLRKRPHLIQACAKRTGLY